MNHRINGSKRGQIIATPLFVPDSWRYDHPGFGVHAKTFGDSIDVVEVGDDLCRDCDCDVRDTVAV